MSITQGIDGLDDEPEVLINMIGEIQPNEDKEPDAKITVGTFGEDEHWDAKQEEIGRLVEFRAFHEVPKSEVDGPILT